MVPLPGLSPSSLLELQLPPWTPRGKRVLKMEGEREECRSDNIPEPPETAIVNSFLLRACTGIHQNGLSPHPWIWQSLCHFQILRDLAAAFLLLLLEARGHQEARAHHAVRKPKQSGRGAVRRQVWISGHWTFPAHLDYHQLGEQPPRGELSSPAMPQFLTQNHEQMTGGFRRDLVRIPQLHYQKNHNQIPGSERLSTPFSQLHLLPQGRKQESLYVMKNTQLCYVHQRFPRSFRRWIQLFCQNSVYQFSSA